MRREVGVGIALAVFAAGLGACGGGGSEEEGDAPAPTADTVAESSEACLVGAEAVGDAVGSEVEATGPVAGGAGGGVGDVAYEMTWEGCAYASPSGAEVTVAELVDGEGEADATGFARLDHVAAPEPAPGAEPEPGAERPVRLAGVGDAAVLVDGRLYVRVGDRAAMAEGTTADGAPLAPSTLAALGEAAASALG